MVFSSAIFLFAFLPLTIVGYWLSTSTSWRNTWLLGASLIFYAFGESFYVLVLLLCIFINWTMARVIESSRRKVWLLLGVGLNLGLLGFYKYSNFLVDNLNGLLDWFRIPAILADPVHLPLGISFFSFQAISYLVDVYRGHAPAQRKLREVALYISLFPQLVAGPIVRYAHIQAQLATRNLGIEDFSYGARRFCIGLAKKVLVANVLGESADNIFALENPGTATAWLGLACYTLQIYFDFSGYSDMAIGLGRMFGFRFNENFNYPYVATSVRSFWRRWHISLSTWFRDYLYIPLGGSRGGFARTAFNLLLVFFLCGLWHGASWNFVVWGLFHGFFLSMERLVQVPLKAGTIARLPGHVYVLLVVMIGWVFFRTETMGDAIDYLHALVGLQTTGGVDTSLASHTDPRLWLTLGAGVVFSTPVAARFIEHRTGASGLSVIGFAARDFAVLALLIVSAMHISAGTYNPFIYFRF